MSRPVWSILEGEKSFDQHAGSCKEDEGGGDLRDGEKAEAAASAAGDANADVGKAEPLEVSAEGRRGTKARRTAAMRARPAPTQSMVESTVRSRARTEKREA